MKRFTRLLSLALCAAMLLALPALAAEDTPLISPAPETEPVIPSPVLV